MPSRVEDIFARIENSAAKISELPFSSTRRFSHALLTQEPDAFERFCIREAGSHELSLFQSTTNHNGRLHQALQDSTFSGAPNRFSTRRSLAPAQQTVLANWSAPSPVKKGKGKSTSSAHEAQRLLLAAEKLLQIYPLERASKHVSELRNRVEQLQHAIEQDQEYLAARYSQPDARDPDIASLEQSLKNEELEVIALRVAHEERIEDQRKKAKSAKLAAARAKAKPAAPPEPFSSKATTAPTRASQAETSPVTVIEQTEEKRPTADALQSASSALPPLTTPALEHQSEPANDANILSSELLDRIASKIWKALREPLESLARSASCDQSTTFANTIAALSILAQPLGPSLLPKLPPVQKAELFMVLVFLSALAQESPSPEVPVLPLVILERPPAVLTLDPSRQYCTPDGRMGLVSMAEVKQAVSTWACEQQQWGQEWQSGEMPTKALYGLVAKGLLKIDRRTVKDPRIFFDPSPVA